MAPDAGHGFARRRRRDGHRCSGHARMSTACRGWHRTRGKRVGMACVAPSARAARTPHVAAACTTRTTACCGGQERRASAGGRRQAAAAWPSATRPACDGGMTDALSRTQVRHLRRGCDGAGASFSACVCVVGGRPGAFVYKTRSAACAGPPAVQQRRFPWPCNGEIRSPPHSLARSTPRMRAPAPDRSATMPKGSRKPCLEPLRPDQRQGP
jgi:hypothetical protein